jgi:hypothetical protein
VRLIDHPQLKWNGEAVWPPPMVPSYLELAKAKFGMEGGVLQGVQYFPASGAQAAYLLLTVGCKDQVWPSVVKLDDAACLEPFCGWLQNQRGKTVREIGRADIDFLDLGP